MEFYRHKLILYSTGDFIDDYAVDEIERNDYSFIFLVEFLNDNITRLCLYPTVIREFQARLAQKGEQKVITALMQELCKDFNTPAIWRDEKSCLEIVAK